MLKTWVFLAAFTLSLLYPYIFTAGVYADDTEDIKDYGYLLIQDTGHIISGPLHWDTKAWRKFSLYTAKAVAMDAFAASLVSAGIITTSLKVITGRSRPEDDEGTYKFQPFGGHRSFPSGHTTQAFSLASVVAEHYDEWWIDTISYGIAGGVGLARVEQGAHFPSDVAAGALIGTIVGKAIVRS